MLYGLSSTLPHDSLYGGVMKRRYDPDAVAWFAAMPTQPTDTVKTILNAFIVGLKTDGLWNKLDGGNVLALGTLGQCLVDFKVPSRVATTAASPTIDFIPYRGASGTGTFTAADTDRIDTGFIPSSAGGGYVQDSAQISVYSVDSVQSADADLGTNGTAQFYYRTRSALDTTIGPCNNVTANTRAIGITDGSGFFTVSRTGAAQIGGYRDGSLITNTTHASTGNPDASIRYLQVQGLTGNTRRLAFGCYGQGLFAGDVALLNTRVQTLVAALAAIDSYDTDAAAWFAAMPTQPISRVKVILNDFIMGLKADDLWTLIDGGNFLCLKTLDQGLVDFKSPSRVATTAPGFTSTFLTYRGVTGSGSASGSQDAYIEIPFNPSTAGGNWSLDSVHTLVACGNDVAGSTVELGTNTGGDDYYHVVRNASSQFQIRSNSSATSAIAGMASSVGITIASRTASAAINIYPNGSQLGSTITTQASVSLPNANLRILQAQSLLASTKQVRAVTYGAGLNATQAANLNTRVQTAISALTVL